MTRALGAFLFAASCLVASCNVFRSFEDCETNADCPRGALCNPEKFCDVSGPIRIGVTAPLSGPFEPSGREFTAAARFVERLIAQSGDVSVRRRSESQIVRRGLVIDLADDANSAQTAKANALGFIERGAVAVVGSLTSATILPMTEATFPAKVPHIAPYSGGPALGPSQPAYGDPEQPGGRYLFQGITTVAKGSASAIALHVAQQTCKKVVLIRAEDQGAYYDALLDLVPKATAGSKAGKRCLDREIISPSQATDDPSGALDDMVETFEGEAGCAVLVCSVPVASKILKTWHARPAPKPDVRWLGFSGLRNKALLEGALEGDVQTAKGMFLADLVVAPDDVSFIRQWYDVVMAGDPSAPPSESLSNVFVFVLDALFTLTLSIEAGGDLAEPARLRDAIFEVARGADGDETVSPRTMRVAGFGTALAAVARKAKERGPVAVDYEGLTGQMDFDDLGVVTNRLGMWEVGDGPFADKPNVEYSAQEVLEMIDRPGGTCP